MTTEGAFRYGELMAMSDGERLRWLQRCIDHNEEMERKHGDGPSQPVDQGFDL